MTTQRELNAAARSLAKILRTKDLKVVFAESCTGGLISAALTRIPGISDYLCGSAVVYRIDTKAEWLDISRSVLEHPGPVSREVAEHMAKEILDRTPEAQVAASITGHLGPDAPKRLDGLVYAAIVLSPQLGDDGLKTVVKKQRLLASEGPATGRAGETLRSRRQIAAAVLVLSTVSAILEKVDPPAN